MVVYGWWEQSDRGAYEPQVAVTVWQPGGRPERLNFLIDSGADGTFLPRRSAHEIGIDFADWPVVDTASGVGSSALAHYRGDVRLVFAQHAHIHILRVRVGIFADDAALDVPVLGRDVLDQLVLILDRRRDLVALLDGTEPYQIGEPPTGRQH